MRSVSEICMRSKCTVAGDNSAYFVRGSSIRQRFLDTVPADGDKKLPRSRRTKTNRARCKKEPRTKQSGILGQELKDL